MSDNEDKIKQLQDHVKYLKDQNQSLIARYGRGVRPSWVSSEIGCNEIQIERAEKEIRSLAKEGCHNPEPSIDK